MALRQVKITSVDNCITYALRRIGKAELPQERYDVENGMKRYFDFIPFKGGTPMPGDILYWPDTATYWLGTEITDTGVVIIHSTPTGLHMAVVEEGGNYSHITRRHEHGSFIPVIQVRSLGSWTKTPPSFILRLR